MRFLIFLLLVGCSTKEIISPKPTQIDKFDIYVNEFLTSSNLTTCEKRVDLENYLDDYFCVETQTERAYVVPTKEWDSKHIDDHFTRVSKRQFRYLLTHIKAFKNQVCVEEGVNCKELDHKQPLEVLKPYEVD